MHRHKIQSRSLYRLLQQNHYCSPSTTTHAIFSAQLQQSFSSFHCLQQQQQTSDESSTLVNKKYSQTLILPNTSFSMRANSVETEPKLQEICSKQLYKWQQENLSDEKKFVLHDGPPYANGSLHMGHALNKILKDFVNRYKLLRGHKIHYIPGWDCHGLPIEMKAIHQNESSAKMCPTEIRRLAREFAEEAIQKQKKDFERWGVMGDWENYYTTMHPLFEAKQLEIFLSMFNQGYIYRGARPVYWSPSSRTALAEAELEYPEAHTSKSIYIIFPIVASESTSQLSHLTQLEGGLNVTVWTTTPWTLMANEAVCYNSDVKYTVLKSVNKQSGSVKHFLVADELLSKFIEKTQSKYEYSTVDSLTGKDLEGYFCEHPYISDKVVPLLHGPHVTTEIGTGFVHTAPGHGMEDFLVGKQHNLPVTSPVDDAGCYSSDVILKEFVGKNVFTEGNEGVIKILQGHPGERLLLLEDYVHKYPYDWRTKKPILIRTTKQWFADLSNLKDTATQAIGRVRMVPEVGRHRLTSFVKARSEWCISRQRVWGVPIPVFYNKHNPDEFLATEPSIRHVISLFEKHGADCWWSMPIEELLAPQYRNDGVEYVRGTDTLDVWFDSGTTWYGVIERHGEKTPVDMYLEGSDQHRGWFQSSLLTSIAHKQQAPYKSVITHGFVLDEHNRKMSKSIGNIFEPSTIVDGKSEQQIQNEVQQNQEQSTAEEVNMDELSDREKKKLLKKLQKQKAAEKRHAKMQSQSPAYGADVLRLWASLFDYTSDVSISDDVIANVFETLKKIRNTERFLLGNIDDFSVEQRVPYDELNSLDRYMLLKLLEFLIDVEMEYEMFAFHKVHQLVVNFTFAISSFYLDVVKDRLYLEPRASKARRSCQTVLSYIFENYNKVIAPILCHLAEDAYQHSSIKTNDKPSMFTTGWYNIDSKWSNHAIRLDWDHIIKLRQEIYKLIEQARSDKLVSTASECHIEIQVECDAMNKALQGLKSGELEEVLIVSQVEHSSELKDLISKDDGASKYTGKMTTESGGSVFIRVSRARNHKCPRCWKHVSPAPAVLCSRCADVVAQESYQ